MQSDLIELLLKLPVAPEPTIREVSIVILGRLSTLNPSIVNPKLRHLLIQNLTLANSAGDKLQLESIRIIGLWHHGLVFIL